MKALVKIFVLLLIGAQGISAQNIQVTKVLNGYGAIDKGSADGITMRQGFVVKRMVNNQIVVIGRASVVAVQDKSSAIRPDQDNFSLQVGDLLFPPDQASVPRPPQPVPPPPQSAPPSPQAATRSPAKNPQKDNSSEESSGQPMMSAPSHYAVGGGISFATANSNVKGGPGFNAFMDFWPSNSMLIKASIGRYAADTKVDIISEGSYALLWLEGSLLYSGSGGSIRPYGGAGGGYYAFSHELSSELQDDLANIGVTIEEKIPSVFGFNIRGGLNIDLNPALQLNTDVKFVFLSAKVEQTITDIFGSQTFEGDLGLNTVIISVGLMASF